MMILKFDHGGPISLPRPSDPQWHSFVKHFVLNKTRTQSFSCLIATQCKSSITSSTQTPTEGHIRNSLLLQWLHQPGGIVQVFPEDWVECEGEKYSFCVWRRSAFCVNSSICSSIYSGHFSGKTIKDPTQVNSSKIKISVVIQLSFAWRYWCISANVLLDIISISE